MQQYLSIHPEVQHALDIQAPVVALESTIISHGMPYPENIATAKRVEMAVRASGATPATIGIRDGRMVVGMDNDQLEWFGHSTAVRKVSRRDIPFVITTGQTGATTVASTMIIARLAGIRVFVTGGIGGVHRDGTHTFDISADLQELAQRDVAVVCAGAKSILDIGLTLEYLETHGVPVIGFRSDDFPAFYTPHSGHTVDMRIDDVATIAQLANVKWSLGITGGIVVANPIPEQDAIARTEIEGIIDTAVDELAAKNIRGKAVTPYLLTRIAKLTGGRSLQANIALVLNNARVGGELAVALARNGATKNGERV